MNMQELKESIEFKGDDYYYDVVRFNIRNYRKLVGYTQEQLAELADISVFYLCQIETGNPNKNFAIGILGRIADALEIDIKEFFVEPNIPKRKKK